MLREIDSITVNVLAGSGRAHEDGDGSGAGELREHASRRCYEAIAWERDSICLRNASSSARRLLIFSQAWITVV